ncbi:MAG: hypothetical protein EU531_04670 [Promethearchaeota archaeon]|nr:MAG: hypothetical protein EU531_04670 [Candidatus Lokiarchaeota archaeon]
MSYNIAFDIAHKPRGKIDENLTEMRDFLNSNGFMCYNFLETPITQQSLKPFDVLVFMCPDFAKISSMEMTEICSWVEEDGGGLFLLSHAGGDKGRNSNLSELSQRFGILFENDQVLDETTNLGLENLPIITAFIPPHPITNGISSVCYRSGCSLTIMGNAFSIASSNETSEPFSTPLMCVAQPENGRVCAIGSYELFRDNVGGGFSSDEHPTLAYNIFTWLVSDYRMDLRSKGEVPEVITQPAPQTNNYISGPTGPASGANRKIDIDFSMQISNQSELYELLRIFQSQINTIKTTIDKLVKTAGGSDNKIRDNPPTKKPPSPSQFVSEDAFDSLLESDKNLTDLPPKPIGLAKNGDEPFIGLPKVEDRESIKFGSSEKPKKKLKKKELKAEKEALESKLNSMRNLLDFIEKKFQAGSMDKKSYEKRTGQLKVDLKKTEKKLDEINELL